MNTSRTRKLADVSTAEVAVKPSRSTRKSAEASAAVAAKPKPRSRVSAAVGVAATPQVAAKRARQAAAPASIAPPAAAVAKVAVRRTPKAKAAPSIDVVVRDAVVARLDAMKANDLKVIDVRGKTSVTDCLVIASGTSTRHVKSMGDEVVVTAKKFGLPPIGIEGEQDAEWMLVDLGDTVVHVMLPRTREFYGLERLWTLTEQARAATSA